MHAKHYYTQVSLHIMCVLTCDGSMLRLAYGGKVAKEVASIESFPCPTQSHEDERLVVAGHHHVAVGLLPGCKDVGRHVLSSTTPEHINHLREGGGEGEGEQKEGVEEE